MQVQDISDEKSKIKGFKIKLEQASHMESRKEEESVVSSVEPSAREDQSRFIGFARSRTRSLDPVRVVGGLGVRNHLKNHNKANVKSPEKTSSNEKEEEYPSSPEATTPVNNKLAMTASPLKIPAGEGSLSPPKNMGFKMRNKLVGGNQEPDASPAAAHGAAPNMGFRRMSTSVVSSRDDMLINMKTVNQVKRGIKKRESSVLSTTQVNKLRKGKDGNTRINQYIVEKTLGKGAFAIVKLCTDSKTGTKYAIKVMNKKSLMKKSTGKGKNAYDCVLEELKVLIRLEHPNIIFLHEIIDDKSKDDIYLVTEFHSKGSLGDEILRINSKYEAHNKRQREVAGKELLFGINAK